MPDFLMFILRIGMGVGNVWFLQNISRDSVKRHKELKKAFEDKGRLDQWESLNKRRKSEFYLSFKLIILIVISMIVASEVVLLISSI
jgi:cytoskeletal protein RodZ